MMSLLDALARHPSPVNLKQLAAETALHPSTAHRILGVMVESRLVDRIEPGTYRLGIRLVELGSLVKSRISVRQEALPYMQRLHQDLGETVNLSVRHDDEVVYIERTAPGSAMMRVVQLIGARAPLHITAVGKIFLAQDGLQSCAAYAQRTGLPRYTENTVADSDALLRFPFTPGQTRIAAPPTRVTALPAGPRNHHWVKTVTAAPDGSRLFVSVGSNSNIAEHGMDEEAGRATIWEVDPASGAHRVFASGLRNPNAMAFAPGTDTLWTVVNERDELGSDLVPDYLTSVRDGGFYGWPYSYYGQHVDARVKPQRPDLVARAIVPDYALGPHTASLGMAFAQGNSIGFGEGVFIGQHGSWNRKPASGYRVIFVPFSGGRPSGPPQDVLTGFRVGDIAYGRPVQVAIGKAGALFVADDVGNTVWRVSR
jgi:glucose/arabinose dehydrogenase